MRFKSDRQRKAMFARIAQMKKGPLQKLYIIKKDNFTGKKGDIVLVDEEPLDSNTWKNLSTEGIGSPFVEYDEVEPLTPKNLDKATDPFIGKQEYFRSDDGKIDDTRLSPYGRKNLRSLQGMKLYFSDNTLMVKGNQLLDKDNKIFDRIESDRAVNKIMFRLMNQ